MVKQGEVCVCFMFLRQTMQFVKGEIQLNQAETQTRTCLSNALVV